MNGTISSRDQQELAVSDARLYSYVALTGIVYAIVCVAVVVLAWRSVGGVCG